MQTIELIKSAIQSLKANKKRSFLTIIGIMIGIAAVIAILLNWGRDYENDV